MSDSNATPVVYTLGSNGSGQLGIGHDQDVSIPRQVVFSPGSEPTTPIVQVAAGGNHTLLLTSDGQLFWAGDPSTGACGPFPAGQDASAGQQQQQHVAHGVDLPRVVGGTAAPVRLIAATWEASVIVQADDQGRNTAVSAFGVGMKGELGLGQFIVRTPSISRVKDFPVQGTEVVDLAACMGHVVAVLSNGDVYGWGNGRKGQLGTAVDGVVDEPRRVEGVDFRVSRAVCGREFTCLFGPSESGEILVLGADKAGVKSAAPATALGWKDVGASWGGVYILNQGGSLVSWGRNDHGQLAPPQLPKLDRISIGSEHAIVVTEDGNVLAWGWGEHGNCGPKTENGDVKGRWNTIASIKYIPSGSEIVGIGAGCATSWISITIPSQP
ncbi:putative rcc1 domain-containing protein [Diaporthe ampelina]|uniref:Putative rcc1 domain-containing protein n=1 Tax=Diaporthe ampelina TaxID=1214573 RepID=A0A0G2HTT0_9PEZI|nr:putative rcc1 domain-containing protein [Diaporthe ampelina]